MASSDSSSEEEELIISLLLALRMKKRLKEKTEKSVGETDLCQAETAGGIP